MAKKSAGLLPYRISPESVEVFLVHPGGPLWRKKDHGAWSIAKGEFSESEDPLEAARREFHEETGFASTAPFLSMGTVRQPGGKIVQAWAFAADFDASSLRSNSFSMEWPPRSGRIQTFPEVDRGEWFSLAEARVRILKGQIPLLDALEEKLN